MLFSGKDHDTLVDLTRQAVAEKNHAAGDQMLESEITMPADLKKRGLSDAVFKAVQQELLISESRQQG